MEVGRATHSHSILKWYLDKVAGGRQLNVYKSNKRYLSSRRSYIPILGNWNRPEEYARYELTNRIYPGGPQSIGGGGHPSFTSVFWLRLRLWIRRARRAVFSKALVRYHLPSLLGKRKR